MTIWWKQGKTLGEFLSTPSVIVGLVAGIVGIPAGIIAILEYFEDDEPVVVSRAIQNVPPHSLWSASVLSFGADTNIIMRKGQTPSGGHMQVFACALGDGSANYLGDIQYGTNSDDFIFNYRYIADEISIMGNILDGEGSGSTIVYVWSTAENAQIRRPVTLAGTLTCLDIKGI